MMMPSIFGENLFDDFMEDFPFYDDKSMKKMEKKLYGHHAKNMMKTDIKEEENAYELEWIYPALKRMRLKFPWKMAI